MKAGEAAPDYVPEFLEKPEVKFCLGYFKKSYADGVDAFYELRNDGRIVDTETRFPDRSSHFEQDIHGLPVLIENSWAERDP